MIKSIKSTSEKFKHVSFEKGFNVVLADRTIKSTNRDSRNGTGKSTLIEIIHFCLGADLDKKSFLASHCKDHAFIMEIEIDGYDFTIIRSVDNPSVIKVSGSFEKWSINPIYDENYKAFIISDQDWKKILGASLFNLETSNAAKYEPTFRSLISYFVRRGLSSFGDPFKFFPGQKSWSVQTHNNLLLGLDVNFAISFQKIKDEQDSIKNLKKVIKDPSLKDILGSIGELQAERVRLSEELTDLGSQIKSFKVHPQYKNIQEEADQLTEKIHTGLNQINLNQRILTEYEDSLVMEEDLSIDKLREVYAEAGFAFGDTILNRLADVQRFHKSIIKNRKEYLTGEIQRLTTEIVELTVAVENLSDERAVLISILDTHSALDEYSLIQNRQSEVKRKLENVKMALDRLNKFEENKSNLKIKLEELMQNSRMDLVERSIVIDRAVSLFNQYSKYLYANAGTLSIDIAKGGYKYKVDIQSSQSQGIQYMKVFCYDLTYTAIQAEKHRSLFLIHDSTIFDGVDERQVAKALELAYQESNLKNYQYICTLNSDTIPYEDFSDGFKEKFEKSIRLTLKDGDERGSLLGFRV